MFHNLIGNSCKFTHSGYIAIAATAKEDEVEVAVTDTGIGIPEDKFDQIFLAFEQVGRDADGPEGQAVQCGGRGLGSRGSGATGLRLLSRRLISLSPRGLLTSPSYRLCITQYDPRPVF